ncbi:hypothetical protein DM01DRAFT_1405335 [Hesseltinella vesiculosa]|uniref:Uncharacterized protein n=1 Tax=Hesseltinella vesiculosa TaxID=101127 RepID=A0A1X2GPE0_9FUNG|nr:hypothetical protein DM01DRAFT_1405335 [Hesseltinella vesiculosa]
MLIADTQAYTTVYADSNPSLESRKLLVVSDHNHQPIITVEDLHNLKEGPTVFSFTNCALVPPKVDHSQHIDTLITNALKGYNTLGVFMSIADPTFNKLAFNDIKTFIMAISKNVWEFAYANKQRVEASLCFVEIGSKLSVDHMTQKTFDTDTLMSDGLEPFRHALPNNDLVQHPPATFKRQGPSILSCRIFSEKQTIGEVSWIDLPFASTKNVTADAIDLYTAIHDTVAPTPDNTSDTKKAMSAEFIAKFFDGSRQMLAFCHCPEYTLAVTDQPILDMLKLASSIEKVKCHVSEERKTNRGPKTGRERKTTRVPRTKREPEVKTEQDLSFHGQSAALPSTSATLPLTNGHTHDLRKLLEEQHQKINEYEHRQQELVGLVQQLNDRLVLSESDLCTVISMNNVARAALQRQEYSREWEANEYLDQIRSIKIALVEANIAGRSHQHSEMEMEAMLAEEKKKNESYIELHQQANDYMDAVEAERDALVSRVQELESQIGSLTEQFQSLASDKDGHWATVQEDYQNQIRSLKEQLAEKDQTISEHKVKTKQIHVKYQANELHLKRKVDQSELLYQQEIYNAYNEAQEFSNGVVKKAKHAIRKLQDENKHLHRTILQMQQNHPTAAGQQHIPAMPIVPAHTTYQTIDPFENVPNFSRRAKKLPNINSIFDNQFNDVASTMSDVSSAIPLPLSPLADLPVRPIAVQPASRLPPLNGVPARPTLLQSPRSSIFADDDDHSSAAPAPLSPLNGLPIRPTASQPAGKSPAMADQPMPPAASRHTQPDLPSQSSLVGLPARSAFHKPLRSPAVADQPARPTPFPSPLRSPLTNSPRRSFSRPPLHDITSADMPTRPLAHPPRSPPSAHRPIRPTALRHMQSPVLRDLPVQLPRPSSPGLPLDHVPPRPNPHRSPPSPTTLTSPTRSVVPKSPSRPASVNHQPPKNRHHSPEDNLSITYSLARDDAESDYDPSKPDTTLTQSIRRPTSIGKRAIDMSEDDDDDLADAIAPPRLNTLPSTFKLRAEEPKVRSSKKKAPALPAPSKPAVPVPEPVPAADPNSQASSSAPKGKRRRKLLKRQHPDFDVVSLTPEIGGFASSFYRKPTLP